jgi:hypothetical protein
MTILIIQTKENINLCGKNFPAQFLINKGFFVLPFFSVSNQAVQAKNLIVYETYSVYSSGSSVLGQLSESDRLTMIETWCENVDDLYQEYLNSLPETENIDPLPELPNWSEFSVRAADSDLFAIVEDSGNQTSLNILNLIIGITNNPGLQNDPNTLIENGRLQKRLQMLINTLDNDLSVAISQFNVIVQETLNVNWVL